VGGVTKEKKEKVNFKTNKKVNLVLKIRVRKENIQIVSAAKAGST
jgi:hypothetical protein